MMGSKSGYLNEIAHVVVGDALVDVDADLARPVDELDGETLQKLLST